jgi:Tfp pilus assembly protein PilX
MTWSSFKETGMRAPRLSDERGIALAVAVFALVVIGAIVAGTFFAGQLEEQSGRNTLYAAQAAEAAEAAFNNAVEVATGETFTAMAVGANPVTLATVTTNGGSATGTAEVSRLGGNIYLIRALGTRTSAGGSELARRSIGSLVRIEAADIPVNAGLTARGNVTVSGNAEITGFDNVPPAWSSGVECPAEADVTGVRYNDGTLTVKGGGQKVTGNPESVKDPTLTASSIQEVVDELKPLATLIVTDNNPAASTPATIGDPARCNKALLTNWGDPITKTSPCFNYFPIIYHHGNLTLQGDIGQGILLVEGDLTVTGGFVFYGPVIVTGTLSTEGNGSGGAKFYGGIIAGNVALEDNKVSGGAMVDYSSCALRRAFTNSGNIEPLQERSWVQLYN